jgi:hypothetical protein
MPGLVFEVDLVSDFYRLPPLRHRITTSRRQKCVASPCQISLNLAYSLPRGIAYMHPIARAYLTAADYYTYAVEQLRY